MNWGDQNGKKWEEYDTILLPSGKVLDMNKVQDDIYRAKAALLHIAPQFGGLINQLRIIYTFRLETMAVDAKDNLFINPEFANSLDLTARAFVLAHEVMHKMLNHLRRGKDHQRYKSNIAADYECNITLSDIDLFKISTMKKIGAYVDAKYSGWGYEKIYNDVSKSSGNTMSNSSQASQAQKNQQGGSQGGKKVPKNAPQSKSNAYRAGWAKAIKEMGL